MVHKYDTERAVDLLRQYQANLTNPQEQALNSSVGKVSAIFGSQLFHALLDIQECYEVTLQLNTQQNGKEDGSKEVWEDQEKEQVEGVSRVRVTSMTSPHRVEWVVGLVSRSHVNAIKEFVVEEEEEVEEEEVSSWRALWVPWRPHHNTPSGT
ncbi:unnamed protein product [Lota lota]